MGEVLFGLPCKKGDMKMRQNNIFLISYYRESGEYGIVYSSVQLKYVNVIFIALKYRSSQKKSGMVSENQEL